MSIKPSPQSRVARIAPAERRYERHLAKAIHELGKSLDTAFTSSPFRSLNRRFILACSPRTGSHLLGQGLIEYGAFVQEIFHPGQIERRCYRRNISTLQEYCEYVVKEFGIGGVFGVKGIMHVMAPLVLAGEIPDFVAEWKFVFLTRTDLVKQAISQVVAELTGSYRSSKEPTREVTDKDFNGKKIAALASKKLEMNSDWEDVFKFLRIEPFRVTYEELAADPPGVAAATAKFLDLSGPPITKERFLFPPVEVQATALNERWARRFHEEGWRF